MKNDNGSPIGSRAFANFGGRLRRSSTAQIFAAVIGTLLTIFGIISLIATTDFATGDALGAKRLLLFDVNGWSGVLFLLTGLAALFAGLLAAPQTARVIVLAISGGFLMIVIWSIFDASVLGLLPVNDPAAIALAAIAASGFSAGLWQEQRQP